MSKRAKEAALEAWPVQLVRTNFDTHEFDENIQAREVYIQGYEQAEKDLALIWEDIKLICDIDRDTNHEEVLSEGDIPSNEEHYEEVLKRFNKQRSLTPRLLHAK